jgi:glycosyltransferase involved in cell wall biosynthesis
MSSETFVLRELNAVDALPGLELELVSLFPPPEPFAHPAAEPWLARRHRPTAAEALKGLAWWLTRRPLRLIATAAQIVAGHARRPTRLVRALVTFALACAHARTVGRRQVEHMHAHFATYPALAAWVCSRLTGVPYSFTAHAHDIFVPADRPFLARKLRDARFVVAISEYNRRFLEAFGGGKETPVHVIHCGIDPEAYRFRPRRPPADGPIRALCVASLQEYKGHGVLFDALATGTGRVADLELDLVGGGDPRELEALARELGISDRVRFHGALSERDVTAMLDGAHLFVLPSLVARNGQMDGIPVALIEALACGVCVVASRLSGIPELARDGETGVLAEPGDPASLQRALRRAIEGDCGGASPEAGRRLVERDFALASGARQLAELFRS